MTTTIELSKEEFQSFLDCMANLKEECNDIDIQNGILRQRSNDRTTIFQFDFNPILPEANLTISDIKRKFDLLKMFSGNDVTFDIDPEEGGFFTIHDDYSEIQFKTPSYQFIDNKFMSDEELASIFNLEDNELIFELDLTKIITDRIKIITQNFNVNVIQVVFNDQTVDIKAQTQARDLNAKLVEGAASNVILENCNANLGVIPFCIECDNNIEFKMYKVEDQDIVLNTFTTAIDDVDLTIYTRSQLIQGEG